MEASNAFGTAMAAPGETPVYEPGQQSTADQGQQAQQQAPDSQQQQAPPPATETTPQTPEDPVLAAIDGLRGEVAALKEQGQQEAAPEVDLLTALNQEPEAEQQGAEAEPQVQPGGANQQGVDPEAERQLAALEQLIDERASQMIAPYREEQVAREMKAVQERNPGIMEPKILSTIAERIGALEARTGAEGLLSDPQMVEQMYKVVKAEAADAAAVAPAETGGAVLETNAGQSQTGGSSPEDEYKSKVFAQPQGAPSIFGG